MRSKRSPPLPRRLLPYDQSKRIQAVVALDRILFDLIVRKADYLKHQDVEDLLSDLYLVNLSNRLDNIFVPDDASRRQEVLGNFLMVTLMRLDPDEKCSLMIKLYPCERLTGQDLQNCARLGVPVCHSVDNPLEGFHVGTWNVRDQMVDQIGVARNFYQLEIPDRFFEGDLDSPLTPIRTSGEITPRVSSRRKRGLPRVNFGMGLSRPGGRPRPTLLSAGSRVSAGIHGLSAATIAEIPIPSVAVSVGSRQKLPMLKGPGVSAASFPASSIPLAGTLVRSNSAGSLTGAGLTSAGKPGMMINIRRSPSLGAADLTKPLTPLKITGAGNMRKPTGAQQTGPLTLSEELAMITPLQSRKNLLSSRSSSPDSFSSATGNFDDLLIRVFKYHFKRNLKRYLIVKLSPPSSQEELEYWVEFQKENW